MYDEVENLWRCDRCGERIYPPCRMYCKNCVADIWLDQHKAEAEERHIREATEQNSRDWIKENPA